MSYIRKTITAKNGESRHFTLDGLTVENIKHVQSLFERMGKRRPSESVLVRRAIQVYVGCMDRVLPTAWENDENLVLDGEFLFLQDVAEGKDCKLSPVPAAAHFPSFIERLENQKEIDSMKIPLEA